MLNQKLSPVDATTANNLSNQLSSKTNLQQPPLSSSLPLAIMSLILSFLTLTGYWFNIEAFFRPAELGPATHPITAVMILLLSMSIIGFRFNIKLLPWFCNAAAISIGLAAIVESIYRANFLDGATPASRLIDLSQSDNKEIIFGTNSAFMLTCLSAGLWAILLGKKSISQWFGIIALLFPSLATLGYAFQIQGLHGHMSLFTSTIGFLLSFSIISQTSSHGFIGLFISKPTAANKPTGLQMFVGIIVMILLGLTIIKSMGEAQLSVFALYVTSTVWFFVGLITVPAFYYEHLENQQQEMAQELKKASTIDSQTGLMNRRAFMALLDNTIKSERLSEQQHLWLILMDVDNFKAINAKTGHRCGDKVLTRIAEVIKKHIATNAYAARIDGDELAVLLDESDQLSAEQLAEKLCTDIGEIKLDNQDIGVSVSIGIASTEGIISTHRLFELADLALTESYKKGGNQVTLYSI